MRPNWRRAWPSLSTLFTTVAGGAPGRSPGQRAGGERERPEGLLCRLDWTVLRPLATRLGGDERSLLRGPGLELTAVREYQPGDDVRQIDWNSTARTGQPCVRESLAERALDVWLVLDLSGSIDWGTAQCLKRDRLTEFAAVAGRLLGSRGHRLGALLFADRPLRIVPPATGRAHLLRLLDVVREQPRQAGRGRTDLAAALAHAGAAFRRRSLVIVVSDFLAPDGWQAPLGTLAQRHETVAVRLHDPREGELPDVGIVTLEDPETGRQLVVDTHDRRLRERYRQAARVQADRLVADLAACGVDLLPLGTDAGLLPALVRFLDARSARRVARAEHRTRDGRRSPTGDALAHGHFSRRVLVPPGGAQ